MLGPDIFLKWIYIFKMFFKHIFFFILYSYSVHAWVILYVE